MPASWLTRPLYAGGPAARAAAAEPNRADSPGPGSLSLRLSAPGCVRV